jgi:hypothetical protein
MATLAIAEEWAKDDPVAAFAWAQEMPAGSVQTEAGSALAVAFRSLVESDQAAAAAALDALPSSRHRQQLAPQLASAWVSEDAEAALTWARDSLEGRAQTRGFEAILREGEDLDFASQLELANTLPGINNGAKVAFAERWAANDPAAAAQWAVDLGSTSALGKVARRWGNADVDGLEAFAESLPEGELRGVVNERLRRLGRGGDES